jgi:protein TonB
MFENFEEFRNRKMPGWVIPVLIAAVIAHVAVFGVVVFNEMWAAPLLDVPSSGVDLAVAPPPPPPPPPPPAGKKLETQQEKKPKKVKPTETVQPTKPDDKPPETSSSDDSAGEEGGEEGGVEGGVAGGVVGGVLTEAPPPPPPPPPAPPQNVAPTALEAQRISGDKNIYPEDVTKTEISRSGKTQLMVPVKVCIDRAGNIASVKVMKSSGFAAYDQKLDREIRRWRYKPFMVNGTATPVCSAIQFIYRQH